MDTITELNFEMILWGEDHRTARVPINIVISGVHSGFDYFFAKKWQNDAQNSDYYTHLSISNTDIFSEKLDMHKILDAAKFLNRDSIQLDRDIIFQDNADINQILFLS